MPIKPRRLVRGDQIGIIAPASAPPDPEAIDASAESTRRLGFEPILATNVRKRWGFLAGSDSERASDIMEMFINPAIKAIFCVRGGYGTARLLQLLDYRTIKANPKIFLGYSDITSLHCAFLVKSNLVSFHGPMFNSDFNKKDLPSFTIQHCLRTLMEPTAPGSICTGYKGKTLAILREGIVSGPLIGGNTTLLCSTLGTPFQPDFERAILFLEDLGEEPYRYDRMLTQLLNAGLLQQVAGIAIGVNADCIDPKAATAKEYRQTLEEVFTERLLPLKVPLLIGLPFGHIPFNATLPVGLKATLDANKGDLILTEAAVTDR